MGATSTLWAALTAPEESPPARRSRRDWIVDGVLFVLAFVVGAATLQDRVHRGLHGGLMSIDMLLGLALCVALWWRRRRPFGLGLAAVPVIAISSFAGMAGVIMLFSVAAYRRWQQALLVAALQFATLPIQRVIEPSESALADYLTGALVTTVAVAWGMVLRARSQTRQEHVGRAQAEEKLRVEQIRYAERTRIAREMHDSLAHRISLLSMQAGALEIAPDAPHDVAQAARGIRASAHQALEDLRSTIGLLREEANGAAPQPPQPTLASLPALLEESRAAGMRLEADVRVPDLSAVPDAIGRHALRIVQEALTNARKHAPGAPVDLRIDGSPGTGLTVAVHNRAPAQVTGGRQIPGSGTGLLGLAERAALAGGRLEHGPDERGGFYVRVWLPWTA